MSIRDRLAFDRATVRIVDGDGKLRVAVTNISKAAVNPYFGREIPLAGLDPDKLYNMLRDPEELAKGAQTFNGLPLLSKHVPVSSVDPQTDVIVGSTGTDAAFVAPYLQNSLVIWDQVAIDGVDSEDQREISSAYHYDADMTPGTFEGAAYDGVMRNIRGNHVALVETGRAGPDVLVADELPMELQNMKFSRRALAVRGALTAYLAPMIAMDAAAAKAVAGLALGVTAKSHKADRVRIIAGVAKLAQDGDLDVLGKILDAVAGPDDDLGEDEDEPKPEAMDGPDIEGALAHLKGKVSDEDHAKVSGMLGGATQAQDEPPEFEGKPADPAPSKAAMDAAIVKARTDTIAAMQAIRVAENEVRPHIGEVVAQDSAPAVYKLALDAAAVDVTGVDPSAFRAMVRMLPAPGATPTPRLALDASSDGDFFKRYPMAKR